MSFPSPTKPALRRTATALTLSALLSSLPAPAAAERGGAAVLPDAQAQAQCFTGKFVFGGTFSAPLPAGEYDVTVRTWDAYPGRESVWPGDQTSERIAVAGRTTPDLTDGVPSASYGPVPWRWTSTGQLTVTHVRPGDTGAHSVSWEVCTSPVPATPPTVPEPPAPTLPPVSVPPSLPPAAPPTTVPAAPVAPPVPASPTFTG